MHPVKAGVIKELAMGFEPAIVLFPGSKGILLVDAGGKEDVFPQFCMASSSGIPGKAASAQAGQATAQRTTSPCFA